MSDGVAVACTYDAQPARAPAIILFHGLGGTRQTMAPFAGYFEAHGYTTLACDARAHGQSGGLFGLDGPRDVQDTKELYAWLASQPAADPNAIGAFGVSLGGGAVWNAAAAGVPFKAIVPVITWTDLVGALAPQGLSKSGLVLFLASLVPSSRWDPELLAAQQSLLASTDLQTVAALAASRSSRPALPSLKTPTLLIQGRHDFLFDIDQALSAYRLLTGPKHLYLGDFGHAPDETTTAPDAVYLTERARLWFDRFLKGEPNGIDTGKPIELGHDPWNGKVTTYAAPPATKRIAVTLRGGTVTANGTLARSFALKGSQETFGDSIVTVHVVPHGGYDHLVAVLSTPTTVIADGGVPLPAGAATVAIHFLNESVLVPRGRRVTLTFAATSGAQNSANLVYQHGVAAGASATLSKVKVSLSVLRQPVSGAATRTLFTAADTPGVTSSQIVIGGTGPLSGTETAYAPVLHGAQAYFAYVNSHGGVFGRKIVYKILDDGYDPTKTVEATRELVEQDHVLAIFNSVGTEQNLAVRDYLNQQKVPQLFGGTGADSIAAGRKSDPWTMGYLPSFTGEGAIYGRDVVKRRPKAKIAVLYEDSEYGDDLLAGLKKGLGSHASQIVSTQTYEPSDVTVSSQVAKLKSSGADTFMILALPKQAISAFVSAHQLGWSPQCYVTSVSIDPAVMQIVKFNGAGALATGAISTAFLHDPTNPAQRASKGVVLYDAIMKRYGKGLDPKQVAHIYGMAAAFTMVDALKHAGRNPTRDSLLRAATHLRETNPFLLAGLLVRTSPSDYFPLGATFLVRYLHGTWTPTGKPLPTG